MKTKYSKEILAPVVRSSCSIAQVLQGLGLKTCGGNYGHMKRLIRSHGLSTEHFLGQGSNRGERHKGGNVRLPWRKILVKDRFHGIKESTARLRRAMIESGIPHKCAACGQGSEWNSKALILEIEHKNGDSLDNRKANLEFLCPNCHSQTLTFGSKNRVRARVAQLAEAARSECVQ